MQNPYPYAVNRWRKQMTTTDNNDDDDEDDDDADNNVELDKDDKLHKMTPSANIHWI